jgi:hypothetical protein
MHNLESALLLFNVTSATCPNVTPVFIHLFAAIPNGLINRVIPKTTLGSKPNAS